MAFVEDVTEKKTPTKIYPRDDNVNQLYCGYCRLCKSVTENRHLVRVFSDTGKEKGWQEKVSQTCGIIIDEQDYLPNVICRKCANYVNKMWEFREKCQAVQMTLRQHFSVKRVNITSPCYKQPVKCISVSSESRDDNFKKQLVFGEIMHARPIIQYTTDMKINITNTPERLPM